ncbi:hypothetical protein CYK57_01963 [Actinobacillus pleuropneumoniae]|uniref:Uncharacterized protein n=1 Tax=Actinobacillus pleuropneumoniae serovar 6 str. Femo TaxID=754256 RepID=A0A828PHQ8_ACTPL|nr:hypothetical protein appser4_17740 [Actinobacillus pleuropneumoniae serovar 4 str. M62]EFM91108.1 hypothetical protein appser6_18810 [Actinobacillus pleuropneumoniae serovar 6 str. Femo]EFM93464.1 hypothetical protein appser9_18510 [Actinobacillus pleuropneumoniae serovar 9 str. CVJ13261]EFM95634.1 hypothetical protein appser10_17870 [Actinobacillus pleuropneumoniae serovar 10 str. D13039]EFM97789.1 hypothetical protein appser11_18630 [Actinobacillus pleuropneumoniae serovar 11 str. 56153]E
MSKNEKCELANISYVKGILSAMVRLLFLRINVTFKEKTDNFS